VKIIHDMSQAELGAYVQSHLRKRGIQVTLSGGAVVAIYSSGKYVSRDLDFVNQSFVKREQIKKAMEELGFSETGRHFTHPDTKYFIEFPPGPLSVGEEQITKTEEIHFDTGLLQLITPTDCVKDRLTWYFHSKDYQCLQQAILVANNHTINLEGIKKWSTAEGKLAEFNEIKRQLVKK
jgi:hypothetical protein